MTQREESDSGHLMGLVSMVLVAPEGQRLELARNAPTLFAPAGVYVDLGAAVRDSLGGGFQAADGAELQWSIKWVPAPTEDPDDA